MPNRPRAKIQTLFFVPGLHVTFPYAKYSSQLQDYYAYSRHHFLCHFNLTLARLDQRRASTGEHQKCSIIYTAQWYRESEERARPYFDCISGLGNFNGTVYCFFQETHVVLNERSVKVGRHLVDLQ